MHGARRVVILIVLLGFPRIGSAQGIDISKIDQALGRSGQRTGDVYKLSFPRTDLHVLVHGVVIKPGFALGSWAAFSGTDDNAMVMGDLGLLEDEINPVPDKLRASGFEITAVHNHLVEGTPHVLYMHYMGHRPAAELAASKTPMAKPAAPTEEPSPPAWVRTIEDGVGREACSPMQCHEATK